MRLPVTYISIVGPLAVHCLLAVISGCGDTAADPIVAAPITPSVPRAPIDEEPIDEEPIDEEPIDEEPIDEEPTDVTGAVAGLCSPCQRQGDCGDGNDHCLNLNGRGFCSRSCSEGCPEGYRCVEVNDTAYDQCIPSDGGCEHRSSVEPPPSTAQVRATVLAEVNGYRAALSLPPLAIDDCLSEIALASARELAESGQTFTKYRRECASVTSCACGWLSENQYAAAAYGLQWRPPLMEHVERAFEHSDSASRIASGRIGRIGIGVVFGGDELWLSFTYAN
ncbi:MAG TPA: CAP domain-containing protein [Polyangiaceae bacterium]|nr:CAP domain-containing protein [Polyangiaceae bacterium]